jgi:hypothetical protein
MTASFGHIDSVSGLVELTGEVPAHDVDSVQLHDNGAVVASRTRAAHAPRVHLLTPTAGQSVGGKKPVLVSWHATNPEHLPLTVSIDYSRDGGRSWRTVFVGANTGHASLQGLWLTASTRARLRVRVNDGFNESAVISARFTSVGAPPVVTILSRFSPTVPISPSARPELTGEAIDQAAQRLPGRDLEWYDGATPLGHGAQISPGPLPAGVNHIHLVAHDAAGRASAATILITVSPLDLKFLRLGFPRRVSPYASELRFGGVSAIPVLLKLNTHTFKLVSHPSILTLPIPHGRAALILHITIELDGIKTPAAVQVAR